MRLLSIGLVLLAVAIIIVERTRRLPVVTRIAPEGSVRADTIVRFAWHSVRGAVRYTIDVSTLALARGVNYRWTVTATDARGRVSRSPPVTFTVTR
jgi:hypothetical protein